MKLYVLVLLLGGLSGIQGAIIAQAGATGEFTSDGRQAFYLNGAASARAFVSSSSTEGSSFAVESNSPQSQCSGGSLSGLFNAGACAEVSDKGRLRTFTSAGNHSRSKADARAEIRDTLIYSIGPSFAIDLDFDWSSAGGQFILDLSIRLTTDDPDMPFETLYRYYANSQGIYDENTFELLGYSAVYSSPNGFSGTTTYYQTIRSNFSDFYTYGGGPGTEEFIFQMTSEAECFVDSCSASVDAYNTAYFGIETPFTSQSGYTYEGAPLSEDVPEPSTGCLLGLGLVGVAALSRRRITEMQ